MNRWPAEWEPQAAVLLTWPRPDGAFGADYAAVATCFHAIVAAIRRYQPVLLSFADEALHRREAPRFGRGRQPIECFIAPSNDVWVRDHGPLGVYGPDGRPRLQKFRFDGWGGKHPAALDNGLVWALAAQGAFGAQPIDSVALVVEGGAVETDGAGTLLATRRSLLDPVRNPDLGEGEIRRQLAGRLGIRRFLLLEHGGLKGDDTDGHIDTLARFASTGHILYQASAGPADPNHRELTAMARELAALRDAGGRPYRLTPLPSPGLQRSPDGRLLPASYANFLLINGAVLVPQYRDAADTEALRAIATAFPDRQAVGIDCRPLIRQYGSLHCATMNLPGGRSGWGQ